MKTIKTFFLILLLYASQNYPQSYLMSVENLSKISPTKYEFDIFLVSTSNDFILESYQVSLRFNNSIPAGSLSFSYITNSSQLNNYPSAGTGIYNVDGTPELAFASFAAGNDLISPNVKKKIGRFSITNTQPFDNNSPDLSWNFDGALNTVLISTGSLQITNQQYHSVIVNHAPVFTSVMTNRTLLYGDSLKFNYSATDSDSDNLVYSISSITPSFAGTKTINSTSGLLTLIPVITDTGKTFSVIASVSDSKATVSSSAASIMVQSVNHAPAFTSVLTSRTLPYGDTLKFTYAATDPDSDARVYSISSITPSFAGIKTINSTSGLLTLIPAIIDTGKTFSVITAVSDGKLSVNSTGASITVQMVNHAPQFTSVLTSRTLLYGDTLKFTYSATDPDGDILVYSISSVTPAFAGTKTINSANGLLTLIPAITDTGKAFSVIASINDGKEIVSSSSASVTVQKVNLAPVFTSVLTNRTLLYGDTLTFNYAASDQDGDILVYSISSITPSFSGTKTINSTSGLFTLIPSAADTLKTFSLSIAAFDGKVKVNSPAVNIVIKSINQIPAFTSSLSNSQLSVGDTIKFNYSALDADHDSLEYQVLSITPVFEGTASINKNTGQFIFIPAQKDAGKSFKTIIRVSDGRATKDSPEGTISVLKINHPPVFISCLTAADVYTRDTIKSYYIAYDNDQDKLTYSIKSIIPELNGTALIDSTSGKLVFTPSIKDANKVFTIIVSVTDGKLTVLSPKGAISVYRKNNPPKLTPAFTDTVISCKDTLMCPVSAVDPDGDTLTFKFDLMDDNFSGLIEQGSYPGCFFFIPGDSDAGKTYSLRIIVTDNFDTVKSVPVNISVVKNPLTGVNSDDNLPSEFVLYQNYPNPFNPSTKISFCIPAKAGYSMVELKIFDILGNEVATLINEEKSAGKYDLEFHSTTHNGQLANGIYIYRLQAGDYVETKKMVLLK